MSAEPGVQRVPHSRSRFRGWMPLALIALLMVGVGGYGTAHSSVFLGEYNLNNLLLTALPLAFISMGQASALLVGGFDISVGALATLCVVIASFTMTSGLAWYVLIPGALAIVGVALTTGLVNAALVRVVGLPSIIATLATLSVLQGFALRLRPVPGGEIDPGTASALISGVSFVPYAFIGAVVLAAAGDYWLYRTGSGLTARAVGLDEISARRLGAASERVHWRAYVLASTLAMIGAFFFAAQVGIGDATPSTGASYTLQSLAAAVLGGAALAGGKGSFVGAVLGSVFLSLIVNVITLFGWDSSYERISIGTLTLLALVIYQGADLWARLRVALETFRRSRLAAPEAASGE
jgi:ribose/xylose/arabinose/galactoside ABC-type transport system permease subunit